jgi:hypothetical protein
VIRRKWNDLTPRVRQVILFGAALDGLLKVAAITDLVRRPPDQVRGSKRRWAAAILLINSAGAFPIAYFRRGRRP